MVGAILEARGFEYQVTLIGGAALTLQGWVLRTTDDADILTFAEGTDRPVPIEAPDPLPAPLRDAIAAVARDRGMRTEWLNRGPALQWTTGLPPGFAERLTWRRYGGLHVGLAGRQDLITFKVFAEVDRGGGTGRGIDLADLLVLAPSDQELDKAAAWVKTQDAGPGFSHLVERVIADVKRARQ